MLGEGERSVCLHCSKGGAVALTGDWHRTSRVRFTSSCHQDKLPDLQGPVSVTSLPDKTGVTLYSCLQNYRKYPSSLSHKCRVNVRWRSGTAQVTLAWVLSPSHGGHVPSISHAGWMCGVRLPPPLPTALFSFSV